MSGRRGPLAGALALFLLGCVAATPVLADETLIRTKGSDTLARVAVQWAEAFRKRVPNVRLMVDGGGSGNGIAAMVNGHVEIAHTSRPLKKGEAQLIAKRSGVAPVAHVVGLDAVTIMVHRNNPLHGISLARLAEIYGKKGRFSSWSDLGVKVPGCPDQRIVRISRKNRSGTYAFFRNAILGKGHHFHPGMETLGASEEVVRRVSEEACAIGYGGMAYVTSWVKTLCIFTGQGTQSACVPPTAAFTLDRSYPLARPLFMYTLGPPQGQVKAYLDWVMGSEGQEILRRTGYVVPP